MRFDVVCVPGSAASAKFLRFAAGNVGLRLLLDPVEVTLHPALSQNGERELAMFLRELAREAAAAAAVLDPDGEPNKHVLMLDDQANRFGESGPGAP
ncbi:hypothetical protein F0L68_00165 [Solihabitans fulvus]|uniref:Uncharacterized protein n=1 Tax=Solihabitans fulvus TaxID=1892852 RepID=A0A5B2XVT7_9PSEU|nr:hypothetical protein [Solihabitans fulvus]KAA2266989.1 hypothetical protein F0L68_00165 [Solihabitans fulvus]